MKIVMYLIFLVVLLIASFSFKEGFETGRYAYLAPFSPYELDATTKQKFTTAYNNIAGLLLPTVIIKDDNNLLKVFQQYVTLDEMNYYIQNRTWPINSYIKNYIATNDKASFDDMMKQLKINSVDDFYRIFPVRFIYASYINPTESKLSPVPLSSDIFTGKQPPPVETSAATSITSTISPPFSSENYSKLQSICSTLK